MRNVIGALIGAAIIAGCGGAASTPVPVSAPQVGLPSSAQPAIDARCQAFQPTFDELVACQRANGTLKSFGNWKITWRVRYFVRYWEMPCGEFPTEQEGYVFHMVTNDLYADTDLDDTQRLAIRNAMFDGKVHCMSSSVKPK